MASYIFRIIFHDVAMQHQLSPFSRSSLIQFFNQCLGFLQVFCVEAFGELIIDIRQEPVSFGFPFLRWSQPGKASNVYAWWPTSSSACIAPPPRATAARSPRSGATASGSALRNQDSYSGDGNLLRLLAGRQPSHHHTPPRRLSDKNISKNARLELILTPTSQGSPLRKRNTEPHCTPTRVAPFLTLSC